VQDLASIFINYQYIPLPAASISKVVFCAEYTYLYIKKLHIPEKWLLYLWET